MKALNYTETRIESSGLLQSSLKGHNEESPVWKERKQRGIEAERREEAEEERSDKNNIKIYIQYVPTVHPLLCYRETTEGRRTALRISNSIFSCLNFFLNFAANRLA